MSLLEQRHQPLSALQIIPDRPVRNYHVEALVKAFAEFYSKPASRVTRKGSRLTYDPGDFFAFEKWVQKAL